MKTLKLILFAAALFVGGVMHAQVSVNVHIGTPPQWGPAGYSDARYYYLPDVEAYYDINNSRFIYYDGRAWIHRTYLPARYRNYDLYNGYKVVMTDYRGNRPYQYHKSYKVKYAKGYRGHAQKNIGNRPERGNSHGNNRSVQQSNNRNNNRSYQQSNNKGNNKGSKGQNGGNDKGGKNKGGR